MLKFFKNILFFILFSTIIYIGCLVGIKLTKTNFIIPNIKSTQGGYGNNLERLREIDDYKNIDILFLGSSHAYRGFDPRIFEKYGYSSFNLGSSAQPPFNSYFLLKQYIKKLNPKTILFEVSWGSLSANEDAIETTVDIVSNKAITFTDIEMTLTQHNPIAINTLSYSWVDNLFFSSLSKVKQARNEHDTYIKGGFVERTDTSGIVKKMNSISGITEVQYSPFQMKYLRKIVELCNSNHVDLILVRAPTTKEKMNMVKNFDELNKQLILFCNTNNIKYLDYCNPFIFDKLKLNTLEDFYDSHHMTQSGIKKFNTYLLNDLKL